MYKLDSFRVINLNSGTAFLTVNENSIIFNKSVVLQLNNPRFVTLLIDEENKCIAIKETSQLDENKMEFSRSISSALNVRWNNREFAKYLKSWTNVSMLSSVRVFGEYLPDEKAFVFDFRKAKEVSFLEE